MFGLGSLQIAIIAIVGTVILGLGGALWWERHENEGLTAANATLTADLQTAKTVNDANVAQLAEIQQRAAADLAAVTRDNAAALARASRTSTLKAEIARVKPSDDAMASPVLAATLDRLRQRAAGGPDQDPGGSAAGPAGAAVVRP